MIEEQIIKHKIGQYCVDLDKLDHILRNAGIPGEMLPKQNINAEHWLEMRKGYGNIDRTFQIV